VSSLEKEYLIISDPQDEILQGSGDKTFEQLEDKGFSFRRR
jgi:hypothetical protein